MLLTVSLGNSSKIESVKKILMASFWKKKKKSLRHILQDKRFNILGLLEYY